MIRRIIGTGILIAMLALMAVGCSKDENGVSAPAEPAPPSLPDVSTMRMDISLFESAQVSMQAVEAGRLDGGERAMLGAESASRLNFMNAAVRSLYLQLVIYCALVEPVAAFEVAIHSVPQHQQDGSWLWTYLYVGADGEYGIYLYGKNETDYVSWRMEVSSTDPALELDHFVWFDGRVYRGGDRGYWQFYEPVDAAAPAVERGTGGVRSVRIDWADNGPCCGELLLTINKPGVPEEGSTLAFIETPAICTIEFHNAGEDENGVIAWRPDGTGYIEWYDYLDGEMGCWDEHQRDIDCSE